MARKVIVKCNGTEVGYLNGRGDLYGEVRTYEDGTISVRIDDESRPEFWCEIILNPAKIEAASRVEEEDDLIDLMSEIEPECDSMHPEGF